jgi:hypothetical protein
MKTSVVGRFTRDEVSRAVWGFGLIALAFAFVLSFWGENHDLDSARTEAQQRAMAYVSGVLDRTLTASDLGAPVIGEEADRLTAEIQRSILSDRLVTRVRIWSLDGRELYSTGGGGAAVLPAEAVEANGVATAKTFVESSGTNDQLETFVAIREGGSARGIAEIDQPEREILGPVGHRWALVRLVAVPAGLLLLTLWLLSLRTPLATVGVGVKLYPESIPAGQSLTRVEHLREIEAILADAADRVGRAEERMQEAEERRRRIEGDLQRALSGAEAAPHASGPTTPRLVVAPAPDVPAWTQPPEIEVAEPATAPAADTSNAPKPRPLLKPVAASRKAGRDSAADRDDGAAGKPAAGPQKQEYGRGSEEEAPAAASHDRPVDPTHDATGREPAGSEAPPTPRLAETSRAAAGAGKNHRAAASHEPDRAVAAEGPGGGTAGRERSSKEEADVVSVPDIGSLTPASAERSPGDEGTDESALDVLIRMVEPVETEPAPQSSERGQLRAALARTAARKKPGAREGSSEGGRASPTER